MNDEAPQHLHEMESVVQKANCGVGRFDFHADPEVRFVAKPPIAGINVDASSHLMNEATAMMCGL